MNRSNVLVPLLVSCLGSFASAQDTDPILERLRSARSGEWARYRLDVSIDSAGDEGPLLARNSVQFVIRRIEGKRVSVAVDDEEAVELSLDATARLGPLETPLWLFPARAPEPEEEHAIEPVARSAMSQLVRRSLDTDACRFVRGAGEPVPASRLRCRLGVDLPDGADLDAFGARGLDTVVLGSCSPAGVLWRAVDVEFHEGGANVGSMRFEWSLLEQGFEEPVSPVEKARLRALEHYHEARTILRKWTEGDDDLLDEALVALDQALAAAAEAGDKGLEARIQEMRYFCLKNR